MIVKPQASSSNSNYSSGFKSAWYRRMVGDSSVVCEQKDGVSGRFVLLVGQEAN